MQVIDDLDELFSPIDSRQILAIAERTLDCPGPADDREELTERDRSKLRSVHRTFTSMRPKLYECLHGEISDQRECRADCKRLEVHSMMMRRPRLRSPMEWSNRWWNVYAVATWTIAPAMFIGGFILITKGLGMGTCH